MWLIEHKRGVTHWSVVVGLLGLAGFGMGLSSHAGPKLSSPGDDVLSKPATQDVGVDAFPVEDKVEAALYSRVMRVRKDIAMTNQDLAALGLTEAQAEDVLTRLLAWVELNQDAMIQADHHVALARRELALLQRRIRTGEADGREVGGMSDLQRSVADADSAYEAFGVQAGIYAVNSAPGNIQGQWAQARANNHLPVALRYVLGLDARRQETLIADAARAEQRDASGRNAGGGGVGSGGGVIEAGLTGLERESLATARQNIQTNLRGVAAAESVVLPEPILRVPAELRDEETALEAMAREEQEEAEGSRR